MPSRRRAREYALQMLFQCDVGGSPPESVLDLFWSNRDRTADRPEDEVIRTFSNELFTGTSSKIESIDRLIRQYAENWKLERMAAVDRNILRLAIYELLHHKETPPAVVINEALEIARKFSEEDSVSFINGVLDSVRKQAGNGSS